MKETLINLRKGGNLGVELPAGFGGHLDARAQIESSVDASTRGEGRERERGACTKPQPIFPPFCFSPRNSQISAILAGGRRERATNSFINAGHTSTRNPK